MQKLPQNKPLGGLPPEPKRDQFEDEESFLEARDGGGTGWDTSTRW